jgi:hypothetical protein
MGGPAEDDEEVMWSREGDAWVGVLRAVREEARRAVGDAGGPVEVEVEVRIGGGRR